MLKQSIQIAQEIAEAAIGGFDDRLLLKLDIGGLSPEEIAKGFPDVEVLSQEEGGCALVFADAKALAEFEARFTSLAEGQEPKYEQILFALQSVGNWTAEDRSGWALKLYGFPDSERFLLDVELWPVERSDERNSLLSSFERWLRDQGAMIADKINKDGYIAFRIEASRSTADTILEHRDVRMADLPPKVGIEPAMLRTDIQDLPEIPAPPESAPIVGVLDSGIASSHPLLAPAIVDAQGFCGPGKPAADNDGHGTLVAGIALYDDVEACARSGTFVPLLRMVSGRVLDDNAECDARFIENIVEEAVRYFHENYGCRVFNLSYGDLNKPYRGGRVRGLAYTLDRLSRELDVLFVVPTGNNPDFPLPPDGVYPDYLFFEESKLIDPAPALNVLTVGSLVRWDRAADAFRYPQDLTDVPIAQRKFPSPFTRCGHSVKNAIKPDLVAYGGNVAVKPNGGRPERRLLGELSTSREFASGKLLAERIGTSFAAPHVAHLAARLLAEVPEASANLLRAMLIANASIPEPTQKLLQDDKQKYAKAAGYGMVDPSNLFRSTEEHVILVSEAGIYDKSCHFYEVPVPESFVSKGRRMREITVALAYCPPVRTTRLDYRASRLQYHLVEGDGIDVVLRAFNKKTQKEVKRIKELIPSNRRDYIELERSRGTVQSCTWKFERSRKKSLFVVVSRSDLEWGKVFTREEEQYALVIRLSDRENEHARMYTEIRSQLQARARARL